MRDLDLFVDWASGEYEKQQQEKAAVAALEAARRDYPDPDAAAATVKVGERLGVPAGVALRNPEEVNRLEQRQFIRAWVKQRPYLDWSIRYAPILADSLEEVSILTQGLDVLRGIPKGAIGALGSTIRGVGVTAEIAERNSIMPSLLVLATNPAVVMTMLDKDKDEAERQTLLRPIRHPLSTPLQEIGGAVVKAGDWIGPPPERATFLTAVAEGLGQIGSQIALAAATGGASGAVSLGSLFAQGVDQMDQRAQALRKADTWKADLAALLGGAGTAALDAISLRKIMKLPIMKLPLRKSTGGAVVWDVAKKGGGEGVQEGVEQLYQNALTWVLLDPNQSLSEGVLQSTALGSAVGSAARGGFVAVSPAVRRGIVNDEKAVLAEHGAKKLKAFLDAAEQTKLARRSPQALRELVHKAVGKDRAVLYAPADDLAVLFQSVGPEDAARLVDELKLSDQFGSSVLSGDFAVDLGDLAASETARKHRDALAEHLRFDPDGMSEVEARRWRSHGRQAAIDAVVRQAKNGDPAAAVYKRLYETRVKTGASPEAARQDAALWAAYYRRKGADLGVDPLTLLEEANLEVLSPLSRSPLTDLAADLAARDDLPALIERMQGREPRPPVSDEGAPSPSQDIAPQDAGPVTEAAAAPDPVARLSAADGKPLEASAHPGPEDAAPSPGQDIAPQDAGPVTEAAAAPDQGARLSAADGKPQEAPARPQPEDAVASLRRIVEAAGLDPAVADGAQIRQALTQAGRTTENQNAEGTQTFAQAFRPQHALDYTHRVDAFLQGKLSPVELRQGFDLGPVTDVFARLVQIDAKKAKGGAAAKAGGVPGLTPKTKERMRIPSAVVEKVLQGKHGSTMDPEIVRRLPDLIAKPVAVFESRSEPGTYVFVLDAVDNLKKPVIVPIAPGNARNPATVKSVYGKTNFSRWLSEHLAEGRLLYADTKKSQLLGRKAGVQFPGTSQTTDPGKRILTEADFVKAETLKQDESRGIGPFGPIFTEFRHDAAGAVKKLITEQTGEAVAALHHPAIGDIDLIWGKAGTGASDGYGLAKLVKRHPEVLGDLQGILSAMGIASRSANRINLESETHRAGIRLTWDDKAKHWLMTAFEKRKGSGDVTRTDTDVLTGTDDTAGRSTTAEGGGIPRTDTNPETQTGDSLPTHPSDAIIERTLNDFYQKQDGDTDAARGTFTHGKDYYGNPVNIIRLGESANLSTFLHESGHFFFFDFIASAYDGRASEASRRRLQGDLQTVLDWLGVDLAVSGASPEAVFGALSTEGHERWARAFEVYLGQGKAPSPALQGPFARFKAWLLSVYKSLDGLGVALNPEIAGVFDRLLAGEAAVAQAEAEAGFSLSAALVAQLSPEERGQLEALSREATEAAQSKLDVEVQARLQRRQSKTRHKHRRKIEAEVRREVGQRPVYRALALLMGEDRPDGGKTAAPVKLDQGALVERYGASILDRLPGSGERKIYALEGGTPPDRLAGELGFSSGDEMLKKLQAAPAMEAVVAAETEARLEERYGEAEPLENKAFEAVRNEARGKALLGELAALEGEGRSLVLPPALIKAVQRIVAGAPVGEVVKASRDWRRFARATQAYNEALAAGSKEAAVAAQQERVLAFYVHRESLQAAEEAEALRARLSAYEKPALRAAVGKAGADYLEQIDALLERYGLKEAPEGGSGHRQPLRAWMEAKEAEGVAPAIPSRVLEDARPTDWGALSVERQREVEAALVGIAHAAKVRTRLLESNADLEALAEEGARRLEALAAAPQGGIAPQGGFAPEGGIVPQGGIAPQGGAVPEGGLTARVRVWLKRMDGDGGDFFDRHVLEPLRQGQKKRVQREREEQRRLAVQGQRFYGKDFAVRMADAVFVNDDVGSISREECVMTALHVGPEGDPSALLRAQGRNADDLQAVLEALEPRDQGFVEKLRTKGRGLWSEVKALEKQYRGTAPEDADGSPFPPGSLWPGLGGGMLLGSGGSGASGGPLSLEGLKRDVQRTVAVLSLRHAVRDARKLLHHPRLDAALHERMGPQAAADLDQWLQDAAADADGWTDVLEPALMIDHTPGTPLVNVDKAVFDMGKLIKYSLNFNHPDGKDKARVWKAALGVEQKDADMIYRQVMEKLPNTSAVFEKKNAYGEYFNVFVPVTGPNGKMVDVLTAWIYDYQDEGDSISTYPRLTTIFIPGESHD